MRLPSLMFFYAPAILLMVLGGCGETGMNAVQGTVTLDGKPLESGAISFTPVDGQTQTTGGSITNGQYSVQVPAAAMKVSISAPKIVGKKKAYDTPDSPEITVTKEALPAKYNERTELQLDVKPGTNTKDFDLQSK